MRDKAADRRTKDWTKPSRQAIRYGLFARISDWWCATRDAKKGLPAVPPDDRAGPADGQPAQLSTPRMMLLGQIGLGRIEKEWIVYQAEVADLEARLQDGEARRVALAAGLAAARERLAAAGAAVPDLEAKVAGEERTDLSVIRQRRAKALAVTKEKEQSAVRSLTDQLEAADAEIAQRREQIDIRLRIARRRAAMIEAHTRRRCAAYLTRLVRKHPQGIRLNELMRPHWPERADWARANDGPAGETHASLLSVTGS